MSTLISKCESLLTTMQNLSSSLSGLTKNVRKGTERHTQSNELSSNELLVEVLKDLEGLTGQSENLQLQLEDVKSQIQDNTRQYQRATEVVQSNNHHGFEDSPTPPVEHQDARSSQLPTGSPPPAHMKANEQPSESDDVVMGESEGAAELPSSDPSTQGRNSDAYTLMVDNITTIQVFASQRAAVPGKPVSNQSVSLQTAPRSLTPTSDCPSISSHSQTSYISHDMSSTGSVETHITTPESPLRACQDAAISNPTTRVNQHIQTSLLDKDSSQEKPHSPGEYHLPGRTDSLDPRNVDNSLDARLQPIVPGGLNNTTDEMPITEKDGSNRSGAQQQSSEGRTDRTESSEKGIDPESTLGSRLSTPQPLVPSVTLPRDVLYPGDMERLVSRLAELERQGAGQHIAVPQIDITLSDLQSSIGVEDGDWQYKSIRYKASQKDKGFARVYISHEKSTIDWSAFTAEVKRPTIKEAKAIFEKATQDPPTKDITYYVGHANRFPHSDLDPGPMITKNPAFKDLHTPYHHIGGNFSAHCCHCEDMTSVEQTSEGPVYRGLRSYSEVYFGTGYKLWLVIAGHHVGKFDEFVRLKWSCNPCNQGIRHECLLFAPSLLDKEGIDYIIAVVGRGEAFWTTPGQQHQIINFGHCAARSINFSHPEDGLDLAKAIQCHDCGMFEVGKACGAVIVPPPTSQSGGALSTAVKTKRKHQANHKPSAAPSKKSTRTYTASQRELDGIKHALKGIHYRSPDVDQNNPTRAEMDVYKLVATVQSTLAIQQFVELVHQLRKDQSQALFTGDSTKSPLDNAMARVTHYAGKSKLDKFCLRLSQIRLAQAVDEHRGPRRRQVDAEFLTRLASCHNTTKEDLKRHLRDGNQWSKLCGYHDGLLAFILLDSKNAFSVKKEDWIQLTHEDSAMSKEAFHRLLDNEYIRRLLVAGKTLEEIVYGSLKTFVWEEDHLDLVGNDVEIRIGQIRE